MTNESPNEASQKTAKEKGTVAIETPSSDSTEAPPLPISEDELVKHVKDKDTARIISELLRGQRIASIYIDARSGGVFFGGEAHITGDVIGRRQVKQTLRETSEIYAETIAGRVLGEDLDKIRNVYIKPSLYDQAYHILTERQVLILWGQAHWGKWTTALHLLLSLQVEEILEMKPDVVLDDILSLEVAEKKGYFIDTLSPDSAQKLSPTLLNRFSEHFRKKVSYLIITVDSRVSLSKTALSNNLTIWNEVSEPIQLLQAHLSWYLTNIEELSQALELSKSNEVQQFLTAHLLPGEVDRLAELLARVVHNELKLAEALSRFESRALQQVEEWFENHIELEKRTFMIALAVLSGASYQSVVSADERLQSILKPPTDEQGSSEPQSVFSSRSQRVRESCAHFSQGYEETEFGRSPVEILELDNPTFQPAILRYVWNEYDRLRKPLVDWLRGLGIQSNFDIRVRAAAGVGELSKYNFGYIKEEILLPWANHQDKQTRAAAAFALGIPAWEGEFAPQVLGLLHHWSTLRNNWRLNWTAAAAYGGLVGLRFPDIALRNLHSIAQAEDLRLFSVLNRSVVSLIHAGQVEPNYYLKVLDALTSWTNPPVDRIVALMGLLIFLDLALEAKTEAIPDADKWPTLLWLSQENTTYQERIISLWRRALNTKPVRKPALETLRQILQVVDEDARLYFPAEQIISELVKQGTEREKDRLKYYLERWAADPKEKSMSAERLLSTVNAV
ncbi:MAG TPA: hypothetical protein ENN36_04745 [Candidatus Bathyarchaeota archaeon]|nr:hypothetical protein [Candidatus Bathyarchaeota archaeon]